MPVTFQATHDGNKIYFRFEWDLAKERQTRSMDPKNEVKADHDVRRRRHGRRRQLNGCWATCHDDLRTMKDAKDDKKTKYIKDADLAGGKFMDLIQFRSGKGEKPVDGYVANERVHGRRQEPDQGRRQEGRQQVGRHLRAQTWPAAARATTPSLPGKMYNFGFALHEDCTNARYHYVSLGYQFGTRRTRARSEELRQRCQAVSQSHLINRRRKQ